MLTLVKLMSATTGKHATHSYTLKVHGSDGLARTLVLKISDCDSRYGKLRMSSSRWAMREANYGAFTAITEETYQLKLNSWAVKA